MDLCELMPRQARLADRLAVGRSMQWTEPCHQFCEICTGFPVKAGRPSMGSIVSRLRHVDGPGLPRFIDLAGDGDKIRAEEPRYVGTAYRSFAPCGPCMDDIGQSGPSTCCEVTCGSPRPTSLFSRDSPPKRRERGQGTGRHEVESVVKAAGEAIAPAKAVDPSATDDKPQPIVAQTRDFSPVCVRQIPKLSFHPA